jgi:methyl-accepting chemotaxis protein
MKNMKLGTKIAVGFGALILIACVLGAMAVWNMKAVEGDSRMLAVEYMPEVKINGDIRGNSLMTMYNMRGYAFTQEKQYLDEGKKYLGEVKKNLDEAKKLAARSPHLVKLNEAVGQMEAKVKEYETLADETVAKNSAIESARKSMDESAAAYMKNCAEFLKSQNEAMKKEFEAGTDVEKLKERLVKINLVNDLIDLGNETRVANFKAQATRNMEQLRAVLRNFDEIEKKFTELRAITRMDANIKQIEATKAAAAGYKKGMESWLAHFTALDELNRKRGAVADEVLREAQETAAAGMEHTLKDS